MDWWIASTLPTRWAPPGGSWAVRVLTPGTDDDVLTVAQLNERARILPGDAEADTLLASYITAARQQVERDTGLAIPSQQIVVAFDTLPTVNTVLVLPYPPLQSVDAVTWVDTAGVAHDLAATVLQLDLGRMPARALWLGDPSIGSPSLLNPLNLTLTVGYPSGSVPEWARFGVGVLAAHYLTTARDRVVVGSAVAPMPGGYEEAIAAYRLEVLA
jgi:uncharacterized phiE125 gp8 family phage protein